MFPTQTTRKRNFQNKLGPQTKRYEISVEIGEQNIRDEGNFD